MENKEYQKAERLEPIKEALRMTQRMRKPVIFSFGQGNAERSNIRE